MVGGKKERHERRKGLYLLFSNAEEGRRKKGEVFLFSASIGKLGTLISREERPSA